MKHLEPVKPPTRKEFFTLRVMILLGIACMFFFLKGLLNPQVIEYGPLYWPLIIALIFTCLKILHEWYHYFYITVPATPPHEKVYTVDIFTTFCAGEPYEMIEETLRAIQAITYPHQTYLCDEADDAYLRQLCAELGVHHVTRTLKINAKAGNINNALKHSTGELCVVLDPDHVPFPGFLDPIVSHFNDPDVGFVQIVQAYRNHNHGLIAKGAAQQTFQFYGPMMMTMNKYGTVLAIGANCTFRRTALDSIGGHAAGLAEDMHTAMQLHAKGWKSVYVPEVLARGLVPFTLSAYYKQQLKWSRGVFELLVTSYVQLYSKFTWKQRLHYGVIPFHYFSGVIFLVNFLVPIISLLTDRSPMNLELVTFAVFALPLLLAVILVRHFVQWWVMEDDERGFHVVGGLLNIGTWWVFTLGLIYTIFRKKVPYIPTGKDGTDRGNWTINLPNLVIIGLSVLAILYGLNNDWSPYTLIMAGFAALNCLILSFSVVASRQIQFRDFKDGNRFVSRVMHLISYYKGRFWMLRRRVYTGVRSTALLITIFASCCLFYLLKGDELIKAQEVPKQYKEGQMLTGIFAPQNTNGLSSVSRVKNFQQQANAHFNIISMYVSWGDAARCQLPVQLIDSVYKNNSIPMVTWEPWQSLFAKNDSINQADREKKVFYRICRGDYDSYIGHFAQQVKALKRPVFIRFAHEADNLSYPWSATGQNTADEFKAAWKYIHHYFSNREVNNAIWVWNPFRAAAAKNYFPGYAYIDWLGITNLNYGTQNTDKQWYTMEQLYAPFHRLDIFRSGVPVMLAEMGSLRNEGRQDEWFKGAFESIGNKFPEIKAYVLFNSGLDKNTLDPKLSSYDWSLANAELLSSIKQNGAELPAAHTALLSSILPDTVFAVVRPKASIPIINRMKGVNYSKGQNWSTNYHAFTRQQLETDFKEMKRIGINTVKWCGPGIYDRNILTEANRQQLKINYSFWVPDEIDFIKNTGEADDLSAKIIATVKSQMNNPDIVSWNIGNTVFQKLAVYHYKPILLYQQEAYTRWLKKLIAEIKQIDTMRPVTVDVEADADLVNTTAIINHAVPLIDAFGIVVNEKSAGVNLISGLKAPWFYSKIAAGDFLKNGSAGGGFFIADWQDQETAGYLTFDGLKDKWGHNKFELYALANRLTRVALPNELPKVKILLPAMGTFAGTDLNYHALVFNNNEWVLASSKTARFKSDLIFDWELDKDDRYGNPLKAQHLGSGADIMINIPENPEEYSLCLYVRRGNDVLILRSKLNTPLE